VIGLATLRSLNVKMKPLNVGPSALAIERILSPALAGLLTFRRLGSTSR